jgi:hypothetical protein
VQNPFLQTINRDPTYRTDPVPAITAFTRAGSGWVTWWVAVAGWLTVPYKTFLKIFFRRGVRTGSPVMV